MTGVQTCALPISCHNNPVDDVGDGDFGKRTDDRDTFHIRCECLTGDIVKHQVRQLHERIFNAQPCRMISTMTHVRVLLSISAGRGRY